MVKLYYFFNILFCISILFFASCSNDFKSVKLGDITFHSKTPNKVTSGEEIELNLAVENPQKSKIDYIWEADLGKIEPRTGQNKVFYTVPSRGTAHVVCKVVKAGDSTKIFDSRHIDINIEALKPFDLSSKFQPSGWMEGAIENAKLAHLKYKNRICDRIDFTPSATKAGWGGFYWLDGDGFASAKPVDLSGYEKVTFWACAEGSAKVEFVAGSDKDSFTCKTGVLSLEQDWKQYTISVKDKDLSKLIGAFCWAANQESNRTKITFYIANIQYEVE